MSEPAGAANAEDLKRFSLLVEFNQQDRIDFWELLEPRSLADGETLFSQNDEADTLYLLVRGSLRIRSEVGGRLGLLCAGSALGAISLMTIGSRQVSAVAESDCELLLLDRAGFMRLAEDAPRTACRLVEAVVVELATGLRPNLARIEDAFSSDEIVLSG
jgi:CRP-like cAMP-binding protein